MSAELDRRGAPGSPVADPRCGPTKRPSRNGIPVTSPFRTLLDLAAILSPRRLERALHEAEVQGLRDRLSFAELFERHPRRRGTAKLRAVLEAGTPVGVTRNEFEEAFVALLDAHGLPRPLLNGTLPIRGQAAGSPTACGGESGYRRARRTGGAPDGRTAFESDRQRDRVLLAEGWRSARVTWRQLQGEPRQIAADLRGSAARHETAPPTL